MDFRPSSSFLFGLDGLMMSMADLLSLLVWVLPRGVCSVRRAGSLCEPAAVFLISPYLADFALWCFQTLSVPKPEEGTLLELLKEREKTSCLLVFLFVSKPPTDLD